MPLQCLQSQLRWWGINPRGSVTQSNPQCHVFILRVSLALNGSPFFSLSLNNPLFVCAYWMIPPPGVTVKESWRGSQGAESDFYSKPLKGQHVSLFCSSKKRLARIHINVQPCSYSDKYPCELFCSQISFRKLTNGEGKPEESR